MLGGHVYALAHGQLHGQRFFVGLLLRGAIDGLVFPLAVFVTAYVNLHSYAAIGALCVALFGHDCTSFR